MGAPSGDPAGQNGDTAWGNGNVVSFESPNVSNFFIFVVKNDSLTEPTIGKRPDHVRQAE